MRSRLTRAVLGGAAVLVVATGCSNSEAGTPTAAGTTTAGTGGGSEPSGKPTGPGAADRHGAPPPVENPLDLTKYLTEPCAAISPRLLATLGLSLQGKPDDVGVPSCSWNAEAGGSAVAFFPNRNGLADLYQRQKRGWWEVWEETTVEGYPAVFADIVDSRSSGHCVLYVAPSYPVTFQISEQDRLKERSCERAKQIAVAVVQTMRGDG